MTRILTGGLGKAEVVHAVRELRLPDVEVALSSDMDAAVKLGSGQADYYLGTCHTGAGASLGVLVGLLGSAACHTFGRSAPSEGDVAPLLASGVTVFGFAVDRIDAVVPVVVRAIARAR
ncbi:DUF2620 domain-containing protein [Streptomyces roseoverticillatus]|uniref:DUF2620 domain-containing protein n=1 Tax=Streptomyces roseoverticillatus TaxID=66429 RepID=UPI001F31BA2E|nr:DUF2620 domain-containing protein [Streptomyces roseoverticillatus]MCF3102170.1 DUF2620 domain-containing protein [Streptomyces roseoverticillatus]